MAKDSGKGLGKFGLGYGMVTPKMQEKTGSSRNGESSSITAEKQSAAKNSGNRFGGEEKTRRTTTPGKALDDAKIARAGGTSTPPSYLTRKQTRELAASKGEEDFTFEGKRYNTRFGGELAAYKQGAKNDNKGEYGTKLAAAQAKGQGFKTAATGSAKPEPTRVAKKENKSPAPYAGTQKVLDKVAAKNSEAKNAPKVVKETPKASSSSTPKYLARDSGNYGRGNMVETAANVKSKQSAYDSLGPVVKANAETEKLLSSKALQSDVARANKTAKGEKMLARTEKEKAKAIAKIDADNAEMMERYGPQGIPFKKKTQGTTVKN
jgi:hypothetical protein